MPVGPTPPLGCATRTLASRSAELEVPSPDHPESRDLRPCASCHTCGRDATRTCETTMNDKPHTQQKGYCYWGVPRVTRTSHVFPHGGLAIAERLYRLRLGLRSYSCTAMYSLQTTVYMRCNRRSTRNARAFHGSSIHCVPGQVNRASSSEWRHACRPHPGSGLAVGRRAGGSCGPMADPDLPRLWSTRTPAPRLRCPRA